MYSVHSKERTTGGAPSHKEQQERTTMILLGITAPQDPMSPGFPILKYKTSYYFSLPGSTSCA
jgi:hypothetical protein